MNTHVPEAERAPNRERWGRAENYNPRWATRSAVGASLVPDGASVLEVGAGVGHFRDLVQHRTRYLGTDLRPLNSGYLAFDIDADTPPAGQFDYAVALGVFTYLHRPAEAAKKLCDAAERIIISYCCRRTGVDPQIAERSRAARGWINNFDCQGLVELFEHHGHMMESRHFLTSDPLLEEYIFVMQRSYPTRSASSEIGAR